ncbi:MAG: hypothetical protein FJX78_00970 [Armatimonadetes bacterium]|nr:hypothetical protein [Armatimonadota bacterium]
MNVSAQEFAWHAADAGGLYEVGRDGYLVMDGNGLSGIECRRRLSAAMAGDGAVAFRLRVVIGKRYAIRLLNDEGRAVAECRIDEDGWIRFAATPAGGSAASLDTGRFLTWFRGRPAVDPAFVPGGLDPKTRKTIESDEHRFEFAAIEGAAGALTFTLDDQPALRVPGCLLAPNEGVTAVALIAEPSPEPGSRIRLRAFEEKPAGAPAVRETFPLHWQPIPAIPRGYPDDNTHAATTRPADYRWLACTGDYCWVKARLPGKLTTGEITFEMRTPDVENETCLELHEDDATVTQGTWPIKVGILQGKFFAGFASIVDSAVAGGGFWQSQQAWYPDLVPRPDTVYHVRMAWTADGRYRWWVNDTPMRFSGVAKTGEAFSFPDLEIPGFAIPFTNAAVRPAFGGIDTIALHYGYVTPSPHRADYGRIRIQGTGLAN